MQEFTFRCEICDGFLLQERETLAYRMRRTLNASLASTI